MRRSFTLMELSAIGCVLAAALAVLVPGPRSIRSQDRLGGCLASLRAIGAASLAYAAEDPNELLIPLPDFSALPSVVGEFEWGGKAGRGQPVVPGRIATSIYGTAAWRGPAHRPLNRVLYKGDITDWNPVNGTAQPGPGEVHYINDTQLDVDVYRCPADTGYVGGGFLYTGSGVAERNERSFRDEGLTAFDHYGTSYAARTLYVVGVEPDPSRLMSQSVAFTPLSAVPNPGMTLAYNEVPARYAWGWGDWSLAMCGWENRFHGSFSTISGWHGRDFHFSATFADGHTALVEMKGCIRPAPNLGLTNYPANACPEGLTNYECHRCITFRGPGWQIDRLPAPPVLTPWTN